MSKRDELKFTIKKSLIVGTATATLGAMSCQPSDGPEVISNPVPDQGVDTGQADVADATDDAADEGTPKRLRTPPPIRRAPRRMADPTPTTAGPTEDPSSSLPRASAIPERPIPLGTNDPSAEAPRLRAPMRYAPSAMRQALSAKRYLLCAIYGSFSSL